MFSQGKFSIICIDFHFLASKGAGSTAILSADGAVERYIIENTARKRFDVFFGGLGLWASIIIDGPLGLA